MTETEASGYVTEGGKFIIENKKPFTENVGQLFKGQRVRIIVREDFKTVTDKIRRYYFGPLLGHLQDAFKDAGSHYTKKELDDKMRRLFLVKEKAHTETGEILVEPKSLSKEKREVSNYDMRQYIEQIIRFAVEHLDYGIAYPNEF